MTKELHSNSDPSFNLNYLSNLQRAKRSLGMNSIEGFLYPSTRHRKQPLTEKYSSALFCFVIAANLVLQALILVLTASGAISSLKPSAEAKLEYIISAVLLIAVFILHCWLIVSNIRKNQLLSTPILTFSIFLCVVFSIELQQQITDRFFANYNVLLQFVLIFTVFNTAKSQLLEVLCVVSSGVYYMARNYSECHGEHLVFLLLLALASGVKAWNHSIKQKQLENEHEINQNIISQLQKVLDALPVGIAVFGKSSNLYTNEKFHENFTAVDKSNFQQQCANFQVLRFSEKQRNLKKSIASSIIFEDDNLSPKHQPNQMLLYDEKVNELKSGSHFINMRVPNPRIKAKTLVNFAKTTKDGGSVRTESKFLTGKYESNKEIDEPSPRMKASRRMMKVPNDSPITLSDLIFEKARVSSQTEPFYYLDCLLDGSSSNEQDEHNGKSMLDFTIIPLNSNPRSSEIGAYMVALNDRSYRLEMEKLQEVNLFKNRLLGYISHEVNTPLNVIFLIVDTIKRMNFDPAVRKLLRAAIMSAKMLSYVMKNLEWYTKIMNKELQSQPKKFDLKSVILQIGNLFKFNNHGKKLKIIYDIPEGIKYIVHTDKVMLEQILFNLISNASKYTEKGFIHISVREEEMTEEKARLFTITILDTGMGISRDTILKLGKFFEKADDDGDGREVRNTGLGIGLAVSNMLAKALWPRRREGITVDSLVNIGSSFSFRFPAEIKVKKHDWLVYRPETQLLSLGLKFSDKGSPTAKASQIRSIISQMSRMQTDTDRESILSKSMHKVDTFTPIKTMQNRQSLFHGQETTGIQKTSKSPRFSYVSHITELVPEMNMVEAKEIENSKDQKDFTFEQVTLREGTGREPTAREAKESNFTKTEGIEQYRCYSGDSRGEEESDEAEDEDEMQMKECAWENGEYILIVDDNEFNLIALEQILLESGFNIRKARNGVDAITLLERKASNGVSLSKYCKLILMDINMPVMDGITCTETLKSLMMSGNLPKIPIIANSANIVERQKLSCDQNVELFDGYVPKPIVKAKLLKLVKQWTDDQEKEKAPE